MTHQLVLLTLSCTALSAWGGPGHRIISRIAEPRLSANARASVKLLLGGDTDLIAAATWADEVRPQRRETAPWHYINIPIQERRTSTARFCPAEGCVTRAIDELRAKLKDPGTAPAERAEALKFLIHFVGDLHQPLHAGDNRDRGGNDRQVDFFGQPLNLHRVWDTDMLARQMKSEKALAADLSARLTPGQEKKWRRVRVEDWTWESQKLAAKRAYKPLPAGTPAPVDEKYLRQAGEILREQLSKGGVRLAAVLNDIWP